MKKLFTLLVGVLMAGSAFGQKSWTPILDQDFENNFDDQAMEFFECSESHGINRGPVRVVEDPLDPSNHCLKVIVRSDAEAQEEGAYEQETPWGGTAHLISWDTQFFIYFKEAIPAGKEIRFKASVRGEKEGSFQFQTHEYPQNYIYYQLFPNAEEGGNTLSYTTEWPAKPYTKVDIVSSDASPSGNFQCIALNMTHAPYEGNVVYLDNVKVEIRDQKEATGDASWINFMRKGINSDDPISEVNYGSDSIPNMVKVSNFMIQVRDPETGGNILQKAPIVETGDPQFPYAVKVPTLDHYTAEVPLYEEDGVTPQLDDDGNPKTETHYYWSDGTDLGTSAPARYSSQFFVSTLHKMKSNERYKFVFWVKADKPASLGTQAHTLPTKYAAYDTFGGTSAFPVSTEWTKFELGEPQGNKIPSGANNCQTIAFDCYELKEANNYYFVFEEFSFSEENVTIGDRTLGTPEDLLLAVTAENDELATTVDAAPMLNTFEVEDFSFLSNGKDGIKLFTLQEPDDPEDAPIETFGDLLTWTDGGFVNAEGYFIDDDMGVQIRLDDDSIDGTKINFNTWCNPDAGISFADGKTIQTKLAISQSGWYYIYNVTLGSEETIAELAGIKGVKTVKADNGLIYNLAGQRVDSNYKGLIIKNGQKIIQK